MNCIKRSISPQNSCWIPKQSLCNGKKKMSAKLSCVRLSQKIPEIKSHLKDEFSSFQLLEIQDGPMWWVANCLCSNYKLSCLRILSRLASMPPPPSNLWPAKIKWNANCTMNNSARRYTTLSPATHHINWYKIRYALLVAHYCMKNSFPHCRDNAGWAIPIIHPAAVF